MGKKLLVGKYEFDASANTVTLHDNIAAERLLLITDVTLNKFIYNFSESTLGFTSRTYDQTTKKTTFTLAADCTALGCADTDSLQIFIDEEASEVSFGESFVDPVSKIRVSNPENLIDTDFEYGLQSTKWETLELTNNIPTFFSRDGDFDIELSNVNVQAGSDIITVTTASPHGLQRGAPIVMQSTASVSADGGFIVAGVIDANTFNFKGKSEFTVTDDLKETYTQLFPAKIYTGTEFKLNQIGGITTDGGTPSELTVNTVAPTDFTSGTSMALSNTFAKSTVEFSTDNVDVDNTSTFSVDVTNNVATGEDDKFKLGAVSAEAFDIEAEADKVVYFDEDEITVDTVNNTITFPFEHGITGDYYGASKPAMYIGDSGTNSQISGLNYWYGYYINVISPTEIAIHYRRVTNGANSTSYRMNLTGAGSSGGVVKSAFASGKQIYYYHRYLRTYYFNTRDATNLSYVTEFGTGYNSQANNRGFSGYLIQTDGTGITTSIGFAEPNDMFDLRSDSYDYWAFARQSSNTTYVRVGSSPNSYYSYNGYNSGDSVWVNIANDKKRSSLWVPSHGLTTADNGQLVTITALTGTLPGGLSSGSTYKATVLDANRLAFETTGGSIIYFTSYGSTNLEYRVEYTKTNTNANTIEIPGNTFNEGDSLVYLDNGGTTIGGLVDGSTYYVAFKSQDRFKLSTTSNVFDFSVSGSGSSSSVVNLSSNYITINSHGLTTGDAVQYSATTPIVGLNAGATYWIRTLNSNSFYLHNSAADAASSSNTVDFLAYGSGTSTFTKINIVDLTTAPSAQTQQFQANYVGAADGLYSVGTTATDQLSFTLPSGTTIEARDKVVTGQESLVAAFDALYITNHGFISGDAVTYTETGTTGVSGLSSGTEYYAIRVNKDFLQLALTQEQALLGTNLSIAEAGASSSELTGTISLQPTTIVGSFNGQGTVSFSADSYTITGTETNFTSYFNKGDSFFINDPETTTTTSITNVGSNILTATANTIVTGDMIYFSGTSAPTGVTFGKVYFARAITADTFTVHYTATDAGANTNIISISSTGSSASVNRVSDTGSMIERTIDYVNSDIQITVTEPLPSTALTDVNYLQNTSLLLRPDGFALHRPYDGGVELIPSTNPDSTMIRQTRKYFRYQSGKGIQVSFAVNFSPTSQIDTFTRSGQTGTITTRFPHRLSPGLQIVTSGSTNSSTDTYGIIEYNVTVSQNDNGDNVYYIDGELQTSLTLYEGRTYRFDQGDSSNNSHPLKFSTTQDGTHGGGSEYVTGVTYNGTPGQAGAYTQIVVASSAPTLYTYCENHSGMGFTTPTLTDTNPLTNLWNDEVEVLSVVDDFTFTVQLNGTPNDNTATGVVEYYVKSWENSLLKCGLFDDQNGIFFEFDGNELYCCRRSSIRQISGYANVEFRNSTVTGVSTKFASQLSKGDMIVIKGQSYKISKIDSDTQMHIIPGYRGSTQEKVVITKTETTKVAQRDWNMDPCDGTGYTGFILNPYRIQMAYVDYSWYGAGKVRFGFKDQNGDVKYVHSFVHGNEFTEAYMRSGNVPARYEIQNVGQPTYVPALAHWGTSVIMDGRFDPDKAYIFNAPSKNLTLTGVSQKAVTARVETTNNFQVYGNNRYRTVGRALTLDSGDSTLNEVTAGTEVAGADLQANTVAANPSSTQGIANQPYQANVLSRYSNSNYAYRNLLIIDKQPTTTNSNSSYTIGAATGGEINVAKDVPLISIRLSPSVDTGAPGFLGEREIVNRMQLILSGVNILSTHAVKVRLVLNGQLSSNAWERVTPPSLSQLILHENTDTINGGASVFNFDAQGGTGTAARTPVLTTEDLGDIATLGNSILGGDNVFPDGPDVLTLVATLSEDPSNVTGANPFIVSGRISWSESQA
jgi:hypothetical protein